MFLKQNFLKSVCLFVLTASIGFMSCTNNDTNDQSSTTETITTDMMTDTSSIVVADTVTNMNTAVAADSSATFNASNRAGTAKPNPAKKGMKGKVVINAPAKSTGSMEADNTGVYSNVEYLPMFPGGNKGLQTYFDKNIRYPDDASTEGVEGVVKVSFVVDENGKLTGLATDGQKLGYGLEEEALRVIKAMPSWTPGRLKGNNVKTKYTLPVRFELY
jgi:TonB family protein